MIYWIENQKIDLIQKAAWRLVRSAQDQMGEGKGQKKLTWCVDRMQLEFPKHSRADLEDYVRAAFINFSIERGVLKGG